MAVRVTPHVCHLCYRCVISVKGNLPEYDGSIRGAMTSFLSGGMHFPLSLPRAHTRLSDLKSVPHTALSAVAKPKAEGPPDGVTPVDPEMELYLAIPIYASRPLSHLPAITMKPK